MNKKTDIPTVKLTQPDTLAVSGCLDFSTVNDLVKQGNQWLKEKSISVIDLRGVTYSNSAGLAMLVEWVRYSKELNKRIEFSHVPKQLLAVANVCGVTEILAFK